MRAAPIGHDEPGAFVHPRIGSLDHLIESALASGALSVDPPSGMVFGSRGQRVGYLDRNSGYVKVLAGTRQVMAHRVVWIAARGPIQRGYEVNHRNSVRSDNRITNLEIVTRDENRWHAAGDYRYTKVRPADVSSVAESRPEWLAKVLALAERGDVTAEDVAALRAEVDPEVFTSVVRELRQVSHGVMRGKK